MPSYKPLVSQSLESELASIILFVIVLFFNLNFSSLTYCAVLVLGVQFGDSSVTSILLLLSLVIISLLFIYFLKNSWHTITLVSGVQHTVCILYCTHHKYSWPLSPSGVAAVPLTVFPVLCLVCLGLTRPIPGSLYVPLPHHQFVYIFFTQNGTLLSTVRTRLILSLEEGRKVGTGKCKGSCFGLPFIWLSTLTDQIVGG